jgi:hypothetical protein
MTSCPESSGAELRPPVLEEAFVARWLDCLAGVFGYAVEFPFVLARSLLGRKIRICVPLLAYAHLDETAARRACHRAGGGAVQVRCLAPAPPAFAAGAPTQSLIPLARWADADALWQQGLSGNIRKKIRRCEKDGLQVSRGSTRVLLDTFYTLFLQTMHRHGTPPFPRPIFQAILDQFDAEIITVVRNQHPLAAYFVIYAGPVALFQWAGLRPHPGYATFQGEWAAIQGALDRRCHWFDLGRSAFDRGPFQHKALWRPTLFAPTVVPAPQSPLYEKYQLASAAWRRLPATLASRLGPRLTPHLADL